MKISESLIAHHEAAHAVFTRDFGGQVEYVALVIDRNTGGHVQTDSLAHRSQYGDDVRAFIVDCTHEAMIALAGLYAMLKFKPCRTKLMERRYIEAAKDDIDHAHNCALGIALARLENKVPHGTDALTEEHHRAAAKEHERICSDTERLIARRWDAICRVAAELRKRRFLMQNDLDSLINPQR
jgi:hypothetical protein